MNIDALALSSTIEEAELDGKPVILRYSFATKQMYVWLPQRRLKLRGETIYENQCIPLAHALKLGYKVKRFNHE